MTEYEYHSAFKHGQLAKIKNDTGAFESENHRSELGTRHPIHCIPAIMDHDTPHNISSEYLAQQLDRLSYPPSFQQSNLTLDNHIVCDIYIRYLYMISI